MSDHISGPRALAEPDRGHHRRLRVPQPRAVGPPRARDEHAAVAPSRPTLFSDGLVYRFRLRPLTAAAPSDPAPFVPSPTRSSSFDMRVLRAGRSDGAPVRAGRHCTTADGRDRFLPRERRARRLRPRRSRLRRRPLGSCSSCDAPAALKTIATGELAFTDPGSIFLDGKNVLRPRRRDRLRQAAWWRRRWSGWSPRPSTRGKLNVRIERVGTARGEEPDAGARSSSTR